MSEDKQEADGAGDGQRARSKSDLWTRVGIPALATLVVGLSTIYIDHRISVRAQREQSSRLYTELLSRREQAASELRKDMFATILSGFLERYHDQDEVVGSPRIDRDLMQLELLALNFGEALSLGPLFSMMDRRIRTDSSYASALERIDREGFEGRLESLARRVADAQRASLGRHAKEFTIKIPSGRIGESGRYDWPETADDEIRACQTLGRAQRTFFISFDNPDADARTIRVEITIATLELAEDAPRACVAAFADACAAPLPDRCVEYLAPSDSQSKFRLNPFNLPLIDNSLLSNDQRFAMIMRKFSAETETEIVGVLFPGAYAGRRDKLTLDQAIDALKDRFR